MLGAVATDPEVGRLVFPKSGVPDGRLPFPALVMESPRNSKSTPPALAMATKLS